MHGPFQLGKSGGRGRGRGGGVQNHWRGKVVVEVLQHLTTVPVPADPGRLPVTGVHAQRRFVRPGGHIPSGDAQAERGAQVEEALPADPFPALVVLLTGL